MDTRLLKTISPLTVSILLALPILLILSCTNSIAQENNQDIFAKNNPNFKKNIEAKVEDIYRSNNLKGDFLIAVVDENGLAYTLAMNNDILHDKPSTLNNDSPIYMASHTKTLTGTLLKQLEEEGLIDLDKSLHHYLPELKLADSIDTKTITVKQLLNHTHGIHSTQMTWKTAYIGYEGGNKELINTLNNDYRFDPSHQFRYSNTGPIIAAMILEKVTGNSWKDEMAKRIFQPLGMTKTSGYVDDYKPEDIRPAVLPTSDTEIFQSGFYKSNNTMHAAGGTLSTIHDLSKWLKANINQDTKVFNNKSSWAALHQPTTSQERTYFTYDRFAYSLGWDLATYQQDTILTRFGGYIGISFHLSFMPSKKLGIIAFSSDARANTLTHLIANYAYNISNKKADTEQIFEEEKQIFTEKFQKNSKRPLPQKQDLLIANGNTNHIVGKYKNDKGWPDIIITKVETGYQLKWGDLSGNIYKIPDPDSPYLANLGALFRSFNVQGDTLSTGSLKYSRYSL